MDALQEIRKLITDIDDKFDAHIRHIKMDYEGVHKMIEGERGLNSSMSRLELGVRELEKQMVKLDTQMSMQIAKWGAIGGGFVALVGGLILYYITKQK